MATALLYTATCSHHPFTLCQRNVALCVQQSDHLRTNPIIRRTLVTVALSLSLPHHRRRRSALIQLRAIWVFIELCRFQCLISNLNGNSCRKSSATDFPSTPSSFDAATCKRRWHRLGWGMIKLPAIYLYHKPFEHLQTDSNGHYSN